MQQIYKNEFVTLDTSNLNNYIITRNNELIVLNSNFIVINNNKAIFDLYLKSNQNILLFGEYGKTSFLQSYFNEKQNYSPIYIFSNKLKTNKSICEFIGIHTDLIKQFRSSNKYIVLVFEDVEMENTCIIEFIRMILTTSKVTFNSKSDSYHIKSIDLCDFSVVVTTKSIEHLTSRFVKVSIFMLRYI